jgi:hypothetical protein
MWIIFIDITSAAAVQANKLKLSLRNRVQANKLSMIHAVSRDFRIVRLFGGPVSAPSEFKGP